MKRIFTVALLLIASQLSSFSQNQNEETLKQLDKCINFAVQMADWPGNVKWVYKPEYLDVIKNAGLESVRVFAYAANPPSYYKAIADDAKARGLSVLFCLWATENWINNASVGKTEYVNAWKSYASYYSEAEYPNMAFELLNEPTAIVNAWPDLLGISATETMDFHNAVIPEIRKINPTRIIAVGGPGLNEANYLKQYVTSSYLNYNVAGVPTFAQDDNIIGAFHMYLPYPISHNTQTLASIPDWKNQVSEKMNDAIDWSNQWGKKLIITEWGAYTNRQNQADLKVYLEEVFEYIKDDQMMSAYYSFGFNDTWSFTAWTTTGGWNQDVLSVIAQDRGTVVKGNQNKPAAPIAASVGENSITLQWLSGGEYSINNGGSWQTSTSFSGLSANNSYTFVQRLAETTTLNASPKSNSLTETTTADNNDGGYEERFEAELAVLSQATVEGWRMTNPSDGNYALVNGVAGATMTYTVNVSSGGSYDFDFAYGNAGTPSFKVIINGNATTLNTSNTGGQDVTAIVSHTANLTSGNNTVVVEHIEGWTCYDYMDVTGDSDLGNQDAPAAPIAASITENSITLQSLAGGEYSINNGSSYQSSTTFSGLSANTSYTFVQRLAETTTLNASPKSNSLTEITDEEDNGGDSEERFEAEDASLSSNVKTNETWRMTSPSAGGCGYVAGTAGETMTYTVNVSSAGSYDLDIAYGNAGTPSFKVIVNGNSTTINPANSGGQDVTAIVSHTANLTSGNNTVVIEHISGWTCYDYMDVIGGSGSARIADKSADDFLQAKAVLSIYPNPATDHITIGNIEQGSTITIFNATGQIMMIKKADSENSVIDISGFKGGIYFVRTLNSTTKLIVE